MFGLLAAWHWSSLLHPLGGQGYQFWSGIGSDVSEVAVIVAVASWLRSRNCHVHRCWRLSWHPHPEHGHPVCRRHHPDHKKVGKRLEILFDKARIAELVSLDVHPHLAAASTRCPECGVRRGVAHHPTCSRSKKNRKKSA